MSRHPEPRVPVVEDAVHELALAIRDDLHAAMRERDREAASICCGALASIGYNDWIIDSIGYTPADSPMRRTRLLGQARRWPWGGDLLLGALEQVGWKPPRRDCGEATAPLERYLHVADGAIKWGLGESRGRDLALWDYDRMLLTAKQDGQVVAQVHTHDLSLDNSTAPRELALASGKYDFAVRIESATDHRQRPAEPGRGNPAAIKTFFDVEISTPEEQEAPMSDRQQHSQAEALAMIPGLPEVEARLAVAFAPMAEPYALPGPIAADGDVRIDFEREDRFSLPEHWNLRPDRNLSFQALLDRIATLPDASTSASWRASSGPLPQVIDMGQQPHRCYYLAASPDRHQGIFAETEYRGRAIKPTGASQWTISSSGPFSPWEFVMDPSHPTIEFYVRGMIDPGDGSPQYYQYPGVPRGDPNRSPIHAFGDCNISAGNVWGHAYIALRQLGFRDGLDVAISWIEAIEWAYGAAPRPAWLGGPAPAPAPVIVPKPILEGRIQPPEGPRVEPRADLDLPLPRAPLPPAVDDEPDELQQVLDKVAAARKAAKGNIARAADRRAAADELRARAEAAEAAAVAAERDAEPQRQVLRDEAGRLLELLKADEDFPGIA